MKQEEILQTCVIGPHVCSLAKRLEQLHRACLFIRRPWERPLTELQHRQNRDFDRVLNCASDFLYHALVQHRLTCTSGTEVSPLLSVLKGLAALLVEENFCELCNIPGPTLNKFNIPGDPALLQGLYQELYHEKKKAKEHETPTG